MWSGGLTCSCNDAGRALHGRSQSHGANLIIMHEYCDSDFAYSHSRTCSRIYVVGFPLLIITKGINAKLSCRKMKRKEKNIYCIISICFLFFCGRMSL